METRNLEFFTLNFVKILCSNQRKNRILIKTDGRFVAPFAIIYQSDCLSDTAATGSVDDILMFDIESEARAMLRKLQY